MLPKVIGFAIRVFDIVVLYTGGSVAFDVARKRKTPLQHAAS